MISIKRVRQILRKIGLILIILIFPLNGCVTNTIEKKVEETSASQISDIGMQQSMPIYNGLVQG